MVPVRRTPRIYETEVKEPDLSKQPKKSALKTRFGEPSSASSDSDSLKRNHVTIGRDTPPPEPSSTDQSSPKATPVKAGPPKPMPRVTLLRYVYLRRMNIVLGFCMTFISQIFYFQIINKVFNLQVSVHVMSIHHLAKNIYMYFKTTIF